jgi:hypothetical protein
MLENSPADATQLPTIVTSDDQAERSKSLGIVEVKPT